MLWDSQRGTLNLILELASEGTLKGVLRRSKHRWANGLGVPVLEESNACGIVTQLARALEHIHSNGICHGDVKQENVLFTSDGQAFSLPLTCFHCHMISDRNQ